jgi:hypothetical protein
MHETDRAHLRILEAQLGRMRGMLYGYSALFFRQITIWTLLCIGLLALSAVDGLAALAAIVPFVVPFAFLEAGYSFYYTLFARRHAEFLERAINARLGREALVAHRLEAAYFYPPEAPKLAFLSFGRPAAFTGAMTLAYTVGSLFLWGAGMQLALERVAAGELPPIVPALAVAWTLALDAYLAWHFLSRRDEERLLAELRASYGDAVGSARRAGRPRSAPPRGKER